MKNWKEYTPFEWLLIDVASRFGLDKELNHIRIEWAANLVPLIKTAKNMEQLKAVMQPWIDKADEPAMFVGTLIAVWDTLNSIPSSWQVGQDAAASGPALLSTLMKDTVGMRHCGIIGDDVPDLYTTVTNEMNDVNYDRKIVKKGIVPHVYASEAEPKKVFGKDYPKFLKAYKAIVGKAQEASDFMVKAWNSHAQEHVFTMPDGAIVRIPVIVQRKKTLPCGKHTFEFIYDEIGNIKRGKQGTKSLSANTTHAYDAYILRELNRRCNYNPTLIKRCVKLLERPVEATEPSTEDKLLHLQELSHKFSQPSAVAFEYIDEANVQWIDDDYRNVLLKLAKCILISKEPFEVSNIHDEFKSLPAYSGIMKKHYNLLMVETYLSTWWTATAYTLTGIDTTFMANDIDPTIIPQILSATYSIG